MTQPQRLELACGAYTIVVANAPWGVDPAGYPVAYHLEGVKYRPASWHSVTVNQGGEEIRTCLLTGGGGATGIHPHSAVCIGNRCYVAVGDTVCALTIPHLALSWASPVDSATCFGVYYSPEFRCLVSHGELEVTRLSLEGRVEWRTSGRDIFSEGFRLGEGFVEAIDFDKTTYRIDISTGQIIAELPPAEGA